MRPLGHYDLTRMLHYAKAGFRLTNIASAVGYPAEQVDLILFAKLGRSIPETCDFINAKRGEAV